MTYNTSITRVIQLMSAPAREAILSVGTRRQGAAPRRATAEVIEELRGFNLIGKGGGITRKGSIAYEIILEESMAW